jgi:hypothetical protein
MFNTFQNFTQPNVGPELLAGGRHRTSQLLANFMAIFDNTKQTMKKQFPTQGLCKTFFL